ncbi:MAG: BspA family leucine-rich repeat surface protein, partial [Clostridia bacterium]|nr:BspA family leucine-rich repeat surface protein [Clostridia bacterium]
MEKNLRFYKFFSLIMTFGTIIILIAMGITALKRSMTLKMSFNVEPAILCQIDIKASGSDDSTYKTIFNNVSSVIAENVSLSGNFLILSQTFLNAYKTSLGASVVLKITNLLDNDGIKVTTTTSDGVNATSEVIMQKKGANGSAEIEVNVTNAGTLTLSYEICNEVTYNITYNNIVCVDATADNSANPTTYKNTDAAFLLSEPTKTGCEFLGWTYAGQTEPAKSVSIPQGTTGDLTFTANWGAELMSAEDYWNVMKSNLSYTTDTWPPDGYANVFQITSLTYGFWEEEKTNLTNYDSYSAGINLDAAGQGYIKLFIEGRDLYILSPNNIISKDSNSNGIIGWGCTNDVSSRGFSHGTRSISSIIIKNFAFSEGAFLKGAFGNSTTKHIDLSGLDTSNATTMYSMFYGCEGLTNLDLSSFNTSKVT